MSVWGYVERYILSVDYRMFYLWEEDTKLLCGLTGPNRKTDIDFSLLQKTSLVSQKVTRIQVWKRVIRYLAFWKLIWDRCKTDKVRETLHSYYAVILMGKLQHSTHQIPLSQGWTTLQLRHHLIYCSKTHQLIPVNSSSKGFPAEGFSLTTNPPSLTRYQWAMACGSHKQIKIGNAHLSSVTTGHFQQTHCLYIRYFIYSYMLS